MQISGLEELLNTGHGLVMEAAVPAVGIPHASEAYNRIIEKARAGLTSSSSGCYAQLNIPSNPLCIAALCQARVA